MAESKELIPIQEVSPQKIKTMYELMKRREVQKALAKEGVNVKLFAKTLHEKMSRSKMPFKFRQGGEDKVIFVEDNWNQINAMKLYSDIMGFKAPVKLDIDHHLDAEIVVTDERIARAKKAEEFEVIDAEPIPAEFVEDAE